MKKINKEFPTEFTNPKLFAWREGIGLFSENMTGFIQTREKTKQNHRMGVNSSQF